MRFIILVLFLTTFQCVLSEDWMHGMNEQMQKMHQQMQASQQQFQQQMQESQRQLQQRLQESQKYIQQQIAESQKQLHGSQQQLQKKMQETQQHIQQQMKDAQRKLQESQHLMQKSIKDAQDQSNSSINQGSVNSYVVNSNMGTSMISGVGPDGHRYHNIIEDRIFNNTQYRTITHYNFTSNKMEMSYYTRDMTTPNSVFIPINP